MTRNQTNHHANDRTNHRSFLKFRGTVKIPRLGSKFRGPWKTVGRANQSCNCVSVVHLLG